MISINTESLNATQLAMLYKVLTQLYMFTEADVVYRAGVTNCGAREFCDEVARLK